MQSINNDILISVIIPLYNKEKTIFKTIQTVLSQTFQNYEIIIIDDGSTDNSASIIKGINNDRIKLYQTQNQGVSASRNYGIELSNGKYLFFLDADDIIYNNCLDVLYKGFIQFPHANIICGNYLYITKDNKYTASNHLKGYVSNNYKEIYTNTISLRVGVLLFKKEVFANQKFCDYISVHEDTQLWLKLLNNNIIAYIPTIVHEYHTEYSELSIKPIDIKKEFAYYINLNENLEKYEKRILGNNLVCSIINRILKKDYKTATMLLKKNFKHLPYLLFIYYKRKIKL